MEIVPLQLWDWNPKMAMESNGREATDVSSRLEANLDKSKVATAAISLLVVRTLLKPLLLGITRLVVMGLLLVSLYTRQPLEWSGSGSYSRKYLASRRSLTADVVLGVVSALYYLQSLEDDPLVGGLGGVLLILPVATYRFHSLNVYTTMRLHRGNLTPRDLDVSPLTVAAGGLIVALLSIYAPIYGEFNLLATLAMTLITDREDGEIVPM